MNPFLGEVRLFAGNFAPVGWLFCDGSLLPISQYDALYNVLGTTYGGDGNTTFGVPDLRGRVPVHRGSAYTPGQKGGQETVALTPGELWTHTHTLSATTSPAKAAVGTGAVLAAVQPATELLYVEALATLPLASAHIKVAGSSTPHENRQPYQAMHYIIATAGVYPSQG
jgi:microcystin-dependent protein